ncbi:hypothetical protein AC249_AIPGENE19209 [Exaiptasia diaphana]|nr:hypothetical protein AC249_AIPGENE19209 [Exaiptasia diaphana]
MFRGYQNALKTQKTMQLDQSSVISISRKMEGVRLLPLLVLLTVACFVMANNETTPIKPEEGEQQGTGIFQIIYLFAL